MTERYKYDGTARMGSFVVRHAMDAQIQNFMQMSGMDKAHELLSLRSERAEVSEIISECRQIVAAMVAREQMLAGEITMRRSEENNNGQTE